MSVFLYGNYASSTANRSLGLASMEASNSAARLASGVRSVSGKAGGADVAYADSVKADAIDLAAKSREAQYQVGQAQQAAALVEALVALYQRAAEVEAMSSASPGDAAYANELTSLIGSDDSLVTALNALADSEAATAIAAETLVSTGTNAFATAVGNLEDLRAKLSGIAAGQDYESIGLAALANAKVDAANNFISVDFGAETANLARNQVIQQAAAAMLAQANQMPNVILALFK